MEEKLDFKVLSVAGGVNAERKIEIQGQTNAYVNRNCYLNKGR